MAQPAPDLAATPNLSGCTIVLYDGVCALCNRVVRFALVRDHRAQFRFAALQSEFARVLLRRYGKNVDDLDSVCVVTDYGGISERMLAKAPAVVMLLEQLGGLWMLARLLRVVPTAILNLGYDWVARRRYARFGKYDACPLPEPRYRDRFIT